MKANRVLAGASVDARGHEPGSALLPVSLAAAEMGSARPGLCRQKTGRAVGARGRRGRAGGRMNLATSRHATWERLLSPFSGAATECRASALPWPIGAVTPGRGGHA